MNSDQAERLITQLARLASAIEQTLPTRPAPTRAPMPVARPLPTLDALAKALYREFGPQRVGHHAAARLLRRVYGSCSAERAVLAKDIHNGRIAARQGTYRAEEQAS